jgi:RpiR family transcriptional regulator, carbohydrate utilization regulator
VPWDLGEIWENKLEPAVRRSPSGALERVRATRLSLRKSEAKVADLVLADPARILECSLAELAALAGVSQPTVMRFCVAIGFSGYQEFKLRLAQSLALGRSATHSVISDRDGLAAVTDKIFEYTLTSLDWARQHLDRVALERAVDLLAGAASIAFFGFGASSLVAMDAQQKFPLFDVPSRAEADAHQQIMAASMMREGDVLVVISNTGRTRQIIEAAEIAKSAGAVLIGIVGAEGPVSALCDVSLLVETLDNTNVYTPTTSRIAALVLVDILSTAVALRRDSGHLVRLSRMKQRLNAFRSGDTEPDTSG